MAITGKFLADFDDFYDAVRQAEVELKSMESESSKVEAQLNRMVDSLSGRKVVQQATIMVEAMERVGGITKLTDAEFAKLQRTVTEASAKLMAMGEDVPASFQAITASVEQSTNALDQFAVQSVKVDRTATNAFTNVANSLGQVDKIAALAGLKLGPLGAALGELGQLATLAGTAFGTLGPAALVAAGAFATFKVAKLVSDFTTLDEQVMSLTEHMLGWQPALAQTKEQIEALQFATLYFGREVKDLNLAMGLQRQHAQEIRAEWEALHATERRLLEQSRDMATEFADRFRAAAAGRNKIAKEANADLAKMYSDTANLTGQFQMDAAKAAMDQAKASAEANARGLDLMLLDFIKHEEALLEVAKQARVKAEKDAQEFLEKELHGGMLITGMEPPSLLRPQPLDQTGVYIPGAAAPAGAAMTVNVGTINGTGQQVAESLFQEIERRLKTTRKLPSA